MASAQRKSIVLNSAASNRVFRTFADWQAEQAADSRSPGERGIMVGSSVLWRYQADHIIVTERAVVQSIEGEMLTLLVKDSHTRTCQVHVREIVNTSDERAVQAQQNEAQQSAVARSRRV
ncbi:MAG: hypothetical protein NTZ50_11675 [Chloroflexi bacterium]|nr:hypothetical protein [Chloroflexota bacterium]